MDIPQTAPSLALAAYSQDLITGRRVVVFGNALSGLAETLVERGARLVHVYDEDPTRVSEGAARSTSANLSFAPLTPAGIAARDGAFDVGFIDEVAAFADPPQVVTRLRRALSARGVGFIWTRNPDISPLWPTAEATSRGHAAPSLSYYDLYDLVSTQFDEVRMVGQTPFAGFALADFSPDSESEFSIDTGFVPGGAEEPERYVAVCSHFPVSIEPFCVVQMAAHPLTQASLLVAQPHGETSSREVQARADAEALAATRLGELQQQLAAEKAAKTKLEGTSSREVQARANAEALAATQLSELQQQLTAEKAARTKLEQLLKNVNEELQRRDEWVQELESRAATADERADAAEASLEQVTRRLTRAEAPRGPSKESVQLSQLQQQVQEQSLENVAQAQALEELKRKFAEGEHQLGALQAKLEAVSRTLEQREQQLARAEQGKLDAEQTLELTRARLETANVELSSQHEASLQEQTLQETIAELQSQVSNQRSDLQLAGQEITRAEQQLIEQGQTVRQLRQELDETERFAALLLVEREDWTKRAETETAEETAPVSATGGVSLTDVHSEQPSTEAAPGEPSVLGATAPEKDAELRAIIEQARGREAELRADLQATRWTVDELENRLTERSNEQDLLERLYRAEGQLQRQATLLEQYERGVHADPSDFGVPSN